MSAEQEYQLAEKAVIRAIDQRLNGVEELGTVDGYVLANDGIFVKSFTIQIGDASNVPVDKVPPALAISHGATVRVMRKGAAAMPVYEFAGIFDDTNSDVPGKINLVGVVPLVTNISVDAPAYDAITGQSAYIQVNFDTPVNISRASFILSYLVEGSVEVNWQDRETVVVDCAGSRRYIRIENVELGLTYNLKVATRLPAGEFYTQSQYTQAVTVVAGSSSTIPDPPSDLTFVDLNDYILLSFTPLAKSDIAGYRVYAADDSSGTNAQEIGFTPFGSVKVTETGKWYAIKVVSRGNITGSVYSNWVHDTTPPTPPTNLFLVALPGQLQMSWTASVSKDTSYYNVFIRNSTSAPATITDFDAVGAVTDIGAVYSSNLTGNFWVAIQAVDTSGNENDTYPTGYLVSTEYIHVPAPGGDPPTTPTITSASVVSYRPPGIAGQGTFLRLSTVWTSATFYDINGNVSSSDAGYQITVTSADQGSQTAFVPATQTTVDMGGLVPSSSSTLDTFLTISVIAVDQYGRSSSPAPYTLTRAQCYRDTTPPPAPTSLTATFTSPDLTLGWLWTADQPDPPGTPDMDGYIVRIYKSDQTSLLRQVHVTPKTFNFVYSYLDNLRDFNNLVPSESANPSLYATVTSIDNVGNESTAASVVAINLAPATPSNVHATGIFELVAVTWTQSSDTDIVPPGAYEVHASTTGSGFTPSSSTLKASTGGNSAVFSADATTTFWIKVRAIDIYNQSSSYSTAVSATSHPFSNTQPVPVTNFVSTTGSGITINTDGTVAPYIGFTWDLAGTLNGAVLGSGDSEVSYYRIRYEITTAPNDSFYSYIDSIHPRTSSGVTVGTSGSITISGVWTPGAQYKVNIQAVSNTGIQSPWGYNAHVYGGSSSASDIIVNVPKSTIAPGPPVGPLINGLWKTAQLAWTQSTERDIAGVEVWRSSTGSFTTACKIGFTAATIFTDLTIPSSALGTTYSYWVRSVNTSGCLSSYAPATTSASLAFTTACIVGATQIDSIQSDQIATGLLTAGVRITSGCITTSDDTYFPRVVIDGTGISFYKTTASPATPVPMMRLFTAASLIGSERIIAYFGDPTQSTTMIRISDAGVLTIPGGLVAAGISATNITTGRLAAQYITTGALSFLPSPLLTFTPEANSLSWTGTGSLNMADGTNYAIAAGTVTVAATTYIYFDTLILGSLQTTTDIALISNANGTRFLVGTARLGTAGGTGTARVNWTPVYGGAGTTYIAGDSIISGSIDLSYGIRVKSTINSAGAFTYMDSTGIYGFNGTFNTFYVHADGGDARFGNTTTGAYLDISTGGAAAFYSNSTKLYIDSTGIHANNGGSDTFAVSSVDGSGWLAGNNIRWDANGGLYISEPGSTNFILASASGITGYTGTTPQFSIRTADGSGRFANNHAKLDVNGLSMYSTTTSGSSNNIAWFRDSGFANPVAYDWMYYDSSLKVAALHRSAVTVGGIDTQLIMSSIGTGNSQLASTAIQSYIHLDPNNLILANLGSESLSYFTMGGSHDSWNRTNAAIELYDTYISLIGTTNYQYANGNTLRAEQGFFGKLSVGTQAVFACDVNVASGPIMRMSNTTTGAILTFNDGSPYGLYLDTTSLGDDLRYNVLYIATGTPRLVITGDGKFAFNSLNFSSATYNFEGTMYVSSELDVGGALRMEDTNIYIRGGTDTNHYIGYNGDYYDNTGTNTDGPVIAGYNGVSFRLTSRLPTDSVLHLRSLGNGIVLYPDVTWSNAGSSNFDLGRRDNRFDTLYVFNINQGSSASMKDHIVTLSPSEALSIVRTTDIVRYNYKGSTTPHVGFIAENVHDYLSPSHSSAEPQTTAAVALAAVRGVDDEVAELRAKIERLEILLATLV